MERFSLELEATEVFYGKNQIVGLVEISTNPVADYADHDASTTEYLPPRPTVRPPTSPTVAV